MIKKICILCKKEFYVFPKRKNKAKFCSQSCSSKYRWKNDKKFRNNFIQRMTGENNPMKNPEIAKKIGKINKGRKRDDLKEKYKKEGNPNWKGKDVGYWGVHMWARRHKPKPKFCEKCKKKPSYELANISGEYKRDINDFEWLCRKCHMESDGRLDKLKKGIRIKNV